jgi:hypothetical protein
MHEKLRISSRKNKKILKKNIQTDLQYKMGETITIFIIFLMKKKLLQRMDLKNRRLDLM